MVRTWAFRRSVFTDCIICTPYFETGGMMSRLFQNYYSLIGRIIGLQAVYGSLPEKNRLFQLLEANLVSCKPG
jgi:hypothetical protein